VRPIAEARRHYNGGRQARGGSHGRTRGRSNDSRHRVRGQRPGLGSEFAQTANLSGFDRSPESLRKLQLEHGAEIARAVVGFESPLLFVVVSRYHGGAYVVFSRELNPRLQAFALTGSYASVIGGAAASAVVFTRDVRAR